MKDYQRDFIAFAEASGALRFGDFVLKSGRRSPYFFDAGRLSSGKAMTTVGRAYAAAIQTAQIEHDVLFGPAYKGIPLATAAAMALSTETGRDVPFAYSRKEAKDHGEGGRVVGATALAGGARALLVDDVMTAGTAVRESMPLIEAAGARLAGIAVLLDRQEVAGGADAPPADAPRVSAVERVRQDYGVPVIALISLANLAEYLREQGKLAELATIEEYWKKYGTGSL